MDSDPTVIKSERLDLVLLTPDVLTLSLDEDIAAVESLLGLAVPPEWYRERRVIRFRLHQVIADPAYRPWGLRAISLREQGQMVGHIGFHTQPGARYLQPFAPGGVEFGYTVFPPFRRRGYAGEACQALMQWAHEQHQVTRFVLSISPDNIPSRRLAQRFGFTQVGTHMDEEDGLEEILRLDYEPRT